MAITSPADTSAQLANSMRSAGETGSLEENDEKGTCIYTYGNSNNNFDSLHVLDPGDGKIRSHIMSFGKKDKDVRLTDKQYKDIVSNMSRKEKKQFDRRQQDMRRERESDRLDAWMEFEDEMDDY